MARPVLPERWPIGAAMALGTLVLLIGTWTVSPALTVGLAIAFLFGAACLSLVNRSERTGGSAPASGGMERLRRAEAALSGASSTEEAAQELSEHATALLEAPAVVVLVDGLGDAVHVEAGDTSRHSIYDPGSVMRPLTANEVPVGSITVAARRGRPYTARDDRILDVLADRVSIALQRLALIESVRAEQRAMAGVVDSSADGIFSAGPDLVIRSWNPAMARLTNITPEAAIGQHCCSTFKPLDEEGEPLYGASCPGRKGAPVQVVVRLPVEASDPSSETRTLWLDCSFSPTADDGYVVIARDVTGRKQSDDEKADYLETVSHELRTRLGPLKSFVQMLTSPDSELSDEQRHNLYEGIAREEERLERLVRQLLQATSLEQSEPEVVTEKLDWTKAVREQVECIEREAPDREFVVTIPDDLPAVLADDQLVAQVLANLLSNAVKFSPEGSTIEVNVEHARERVFTTVTDEGSGIPSEDRERVFDKFTRLEDHGTPPQEGVGLGLYIVRRSIEAMGGSVWVDEGPEGGAALSFTLPAVPVKAKKSAVRTR